METLDIALGGFHLCTIAVICLVSMHPILKGMFKYSCISLGACAAEVC